ncbi:MAG: hypothetical protein JWO27_1489 [Frankiales bacterium]|nr:hypothetical protein [Frankiales bacterium]
MLYLPVTDLEALERDPDVAALWFADGEPVDIGTAWHGLHVLLNGSAGGGSPPLYDAVLGGTPVGDPSSYEPIRFVSPADVKAVAAALPTAEELTPRFTHKAMKQAEAYPDSAWEQPDVLTTLLLPAYERLLVLFTNAAAAGQAVLITLDRS